jgi:hypothetical protein
MPASASSPPILFGDKGGNALAMDLIERIRSHPFLQPGPLHEMVKSEGDMENASGTALLSF